MVESPNMERRAQWLAFGRRSCERRRGAGMEQKLRGGRNNLDRRSNAGRYGLAAPCSIKRAVRLVSPEKGLEAGGAFKPNICRKA